MVVAVRPDGLRGGRGLVRNGRDVELGTISCPSALVVIYDGHIGLWSGDQSPADIEPASLGVEDLPWLPTSRAP